MNDSTPSLAAESRLQSVARIVDEISNQLQADLPVNIDSYIQRLPDLEQEIRDTYEALVQMQRFRDMSPPSDASRYGDPLDGIPPQQMVGEFRIVRELGRGGMGVVYEAHQLSLARRVALKVLPFAALLDPKHLERFRTEARAAALLKHPNIVGVHSVGCERGVHYYAMELVEGPSLAEFICRLKGENSEGEHEREAFDSVIQRADTNPISRLSTEHSANRQTFFRSVAKLGIQAANALGFAHQAGIVHRDIKPSNLLLDQVASVHIADFGLARIQTNEPITMTGDLVGTLRYMSPEQVEGHVVDERTDIYSLGATLFELLTLRPPFIEENRNQLMRAIAEVPVVAPHRLAREIPSDLSNIVTKCLHKAPSERYQNAAELADDLQRFLDHRSIKALPISHVHRLQYFAKRNPATAWLISLTIALLAILTAGSLSAAWKFARDANTRSVQLREQQLAAYARDMHLIKIAVETGAFEEAERRLLKWVPKDGDLDDRGMEWYFLWQLGHPTDIQQSIAHETYAADVAFSPDGKLLADAFGNDAVPIWDLTKPGSPPIKTLPCKVIEIFVAETFAYGGSHVLVVGDQAGNVYLWDWKTLEPVIEPITVSTGTSVSYVDSVQIDSSGTYLAVGVTGADDRGHVEVHDIRQRQLVFQKPRRTGKPYVSFDQHGRLIVSSKGEPRVELFDISSGEQVGAHDVAGTVARTTLSVDRATLAVNVDRQLGSHRESWIEIRTLADWSEVFRFYLPEVEIESMAFSHHGHQLAVGGDDGRIWQVDLSAQTIASRQLHEGRVTSVNFSPDDQTLATTGSDKFIRLMDAKWPNAKTDHPVVRPQDFEPNFALGAAFLDAHTVCTSREDRFVDIWDAATGQRIGEPLTLDVGFGTRVRLDAHSDQGLLAAAQMQWPVIWDQPGRVTTWKRIGESLELLGQYDLPGGVLSVSMPFSPDGRYLAVCGRRWISIIDNLNPKAPPRVKEFTEGWVKSCAFSTDGKTLACAVAADKTHFLDVVTLEPVHQPFVTDATLADCIAYLPGTHHLAVVGFDHELKVFDVETGKLLRKSERYPSFLATVRVSPDGSRIGVGAMDGKFRIFRTEDCQELINFDTPNWYCYCDFSPDSQSMIIAAGLDAFVVRGSGADALSKLSVAELKDIACANLRTLSKD